MTHPLAQLREEAGLGLRELGRQSGVSPAVISKIENGLRVGSAETWKKIGDALGLSDTEIFENMRGKLLYETLAHSVDQIVECHKIVIDPRYEEVVAQVAWVGLYSNAAQIVKLTSSDPFVQRAIAAANTSPGGES